MVEFDVICDSLLLKMAHKILIYLLNMVEFDVICDSLLLKMTHRNSWFIY